MGNTENLTGLVPHAPTCSGGAGPRRGSPSPDSPPPGSPAQEKSIADNQQIDVHASLASEPDKGKRSGVVLALLLIYLIWGSTYLGMRFALESFPPFIMAGIRFIIAGSILFVFLRVRGHAAPTRKQWAGAALIGVLLIVCGNGGVSFAEQWVASGLAAVAIAAVPVWTALILGLMGRWPRKLEWLGLGLGLVGVVLLNLENGLWTNPIGAVALLLAPLGWSLGSALSTRVSLPSGLMASAAQMLIGGCVMLLLALVLGERVNGAPSTLSLLALGYLIVVGALVGYSCYIYLLRNARPALATSYAYVNPVVAVILGVALAGEKITLVGILAMLVILTGVGLVSLRGKHS